MSLFIRRFSTICTKKVYRNIPLQHQHRLFSDTVNFFFIEGKSGDKIPVIGEVGKTVLDVAVAHDIDIEGACGCELAFQHVMLLFRKNCLIFCHQKKKRKMICWI